MHLLNNKKRAIRKLCAALLLLALSLSACTSNTNTPTTTGIKGASAAVPVPLATPHPLTDQPSALQGKLPAGQLLPSTQVLPLTFNLIYNDAALEQDLSQFYTPGSPAYHQFLTPDQLVQRYAVSDAQLQQVQDWLKQQGYTIVSVDALRSSISVQASVATIERSLHTRLRSYTLSGHSFFLQENNPVLSGSIATLVQSVVGLDNFAIPDIKPTLQAHQQNSGKGDCRQYGAKQTLTRDKLAAAYQIDTLYQHGIQGQGMHIGIAEFSEPFDPADLANYAACAHTPVPHIATVNIDGKVAPGAGEGEAALDVELIAGLAPQAQITIYQANIDQISFAKGLVDLLTRVAHDRQVEVLSISYGTSESNFSASEQAAVNRALRLLASEGISVFISSGDCGAYSSRIHQLASVSFPASAPYAIAVGGTHLQVNDRNQRTSETTWGEDDGAALCQNEWGSGGGVSQNSAFKRPSWQVGTGTTNHYDGAASNVLINPIPPVPVEAPNGLRQVPDVGAAAYPNIAIYYQKSWLAFGGTSAAAPIWAAGTLLVDQALHQHGKTALGSVPEFYTLANHSGSFHPYTDITQGNNLFYPATKGWDYSTGWGSPNFYDIYQLQASR